MENKLDFGATEAKLFGTNSEGNQEGRPGKKKKGRIDASSSRKRTTQET